MSKADLTPLLTMMEARNRSGADHGDIIDSIMAGDPVMIALPPSAKRKLLREIDIRRRVERAQDDAEVERRLREARNA